MRKSKKNEEKVFKVLSHPIRRSIIRLLGNRGAASFTTLSKLEEQPGKLYYHLKQLDDYITQDQEKRYILNDSGEQLYRKLDVGSVTHGRSLPSMESLLTHLFRRVEPLSRYLLVAICVGFLVYLTQYWQVILLGYYFLPHPPLPSWYLSLATLLGIPLLSLLLTKTLFTLETPHVSAVLFTSVISLLPTAFIAFFSSFFSVSSTVTLLLLGLGQFIGIEINASGISAITRLSLKKTISIPLLIHFLFSLPLVLLL